MNFEQKHKKTCKFKSVCFDDIIFSLQRFGGASTYWRQLTSRIDSTLNDDTYHITGSRFGRLLRPKTNASVFHSSHFRISSNPSVANVVTIHDLTYEKGYVNGVGRQLNLFERRRSVQKADAIICISQSTKNDLLEIYHRDVSGKPIYVIHHGPTVNCEVESRPEFTPSEKSFLKSKFFLFVGSRCGYKNFDQALIGVKRLAERVNGKINLVCTGAPLNRFEHARIEKLGITSSVLCMSYIEKSKLNWLYNNALSLLYLSSYEGFGMPVLDAMALGCPVIGCDAASIPEISGNAGTLIETNNISELESAMVLSLDDEIRREKILNGLEQSKRFSWDESASRHLEVYKMFM
jgi:glycosyltransferase involved in cell wall biosynthesis